MKRYRHQTLTRVFSLTITCSLGLAWSGGGAHSSVSYQDAHEPSNSFVQDASDPPLESDTSVSTADGFEFMNSEVDIVSAMYGTDDETSRRHLAQSARSGELGEMLRNRFPNTRTISRV